MNKIAFFLGIVAVSAEDCFNNKLKYPKFLQSTASPQEASCNCIETSSHLNAIFVGGYVKKGSPLVPNAENDYTPVIACINADTKLY